MNIDESIKKYVEYVMETINKYSKDSQLIYNDQVNPSDLNRVLAEYLPTNLSIIAEYQRAKAAKFVLQQEYQKWYDTKFIQTKKVLMAEYESKKIKVSVSEIDTETRNKNSDEYYEWQIRLNEVEMKVSFLRRVVEQYKGFQNVLVALSQNLRSELSTINIENRMNNAEVDRTKVRTRFPKEE